MPHPSPLRHAWTLVVCMLLGACASTPGRGMPSHYAWDNSVSAACRANPANCAALTGKASTTASVPTVATAGYSLYQAVRVLDDVTKTSIAEALKKCATEARFEVLLRYDGYFKGMGPSPDECQEETVDKQGRRVTWAMRLGLEMHEVALKCARAELSKLRPGGFSIEPRYHYDPQTGQKRLVSPEEERALEASGNGGELLGTLMPDIAIHPGDPLNIQAVYDFKFPCVNTDQMPKWREYSSGPYQGQNQSDVYKQILSQEIFRVAPHIGVVP